MILLLDNYDSFTYNLAQYLGELGCEVEVHRNDKISVEDIARKKPERIVISPGPCTPQEAGISVELIEEFFKALCTNAKMNLHINVPYGGNNHHISESIFKATAKALRQAVSLDPRNMDVPSTKGSL